MSIYSKVTEQDLINLRKIAEQQKEQRAPKIKKKLKQTHDIKFAELLSPVTKNLDEVNKSTQQSLSPITKNQIPLMRVLKNHNHKHLNHL